MSFTLMDGGVGQELLARYGEPATRLWSAKVIDRRPDLVEAVHADFLSAGADVITVASYTITPTRLDGDGALDAFEPLQRAALDAARRARDCVAPKALITGCLPPLAASYRPELRLSEKRAVDEYQRIADLQADAVDLMLCETISSVAEARQATCAGAATGLPVWTALCVHELDGSRLHSGEPILEAALAALDAGASRILINCSPPEATTTALDLLLAAGLQTGGYANGFTTVEPLIEGATTDALQRRKDLTPEAYADIAMGWAYAGVGVIGGCCNIGVAHIAELAERRRSLPPQATSSGQGRVGLI